MGFLSSYFGCLFAIATALALCVYGADYFHKWANTHAENIHGKLFRLAHQVKDETVKGKMNDAIRVAVMAGDVNQLQRIGGRISLHLEKEKANATANAG